MTARNDITGDVIATKGSTDAYRDGWDRIFGRKTEPVPAPVEVKIVIDEDTIAVNMKLERDKLTAEWWKFCQDNQQGEHVMPFSEWRQTYHPSDEGNAPD